MIFKNEYSIFGFFIVNLVNVDCIIDDIFSNFMRIKDVEQQKNEEKGEILLFERGEKCNDEGFLF